MALPILAILAAAQGVYGAVKATNASKDFNAANAQRTPYKTPEEYEKILNATQANAQSGFDAGTMNYLTSQNDRNFSQGLGALQRLGGDANSVAAMFDQQMQQTMKIGAQNHALNLENFSKYLGALDMIGNSKVAEYTSQQNIVKDQMQAANANRAAAFGNIQSAVNTGIAAYQEYKMDKLYDKNPEKASALYGNRASVSGAPRGTYSIGGTDATAPPQSIIRQGRTYTWNPNTLKYE